MSNVLVCYKQKSGNPCFFHTLCDIQRKTHLRYKIVQKMEIYSVNVDMQMQAT